MNYNPKYITVDVDSQPDVVSKVPADRVGILVDDDVD